MKINRGYQFQLDPTPEQAEDFARNAGVCRLVYNIALEQRSNGPPVPTRDGHLNGIAVPRADPAPCRGRLDRLRMGHCAAAGATRSGHRLQKLLPKDGRVSDAAQEGRQRQLRIQGNQVEFRRLNKSCGLVKLPKIGEVRFRWTRDIPGKLKNVTVGLDPLGWRVSFCTEQAVEIGWNFGPAVGIDRGVAHALAFSDGTFADLPKVPMNVLERKAKWHQRALSRCNKGSNRRKKVKRLVAGKKSKTARICKHFNLVLVSDHQKLRRRIDRGAEDENHDGVRRRHGRGTRKNVAQKAGLNRGIHSVGWYQFQTLLA